jgi:hypothetical protein
MMAIGAFAVLGAQQKPEKEVPANKYMRLVLKKHNAVAHGILAFIPATYSLTHLYTNSLHNGSLYTASNIVYVAVFGFAAKYLGEALQALRDDAINLDTIKAVYECLFMLTRCCARLQQHVAVDGALSGSHQAAKQTMPTHIKDNDAVKHHPCNRAWECPSVLLNVFLALGTQDDSRLWVMLPAWSLR